MKLLLISITLLLSACAPSGSGPASGGSSPTPQATPTLESKVLASMWRADVSPPAQNLGFDISDGQAAMFVDLSNPNEIDIFIGPGTDSLECTFQRHITGSETAGTLTLGSFQDSGQPNLAGYCQSLQGSWSYQKNQSSLTLCQSALDCISFN